MKNIVMPKLPKLLSSLIFLFLGLSIIYAQDTEPIETAYITWSPNGQYIAIASHSQLDIINASTSEVLHRFSFIEDLFATPIWSPDSEKIAFGNDTNLEVWANLSINPSQDAIYNGEIRGFGAVTASSWSPDGSKIAFSTGDSIGIWDTGTHSQIMNYNPDIGHPWSLDWGKDNISLLIGGTQSLLILDTESATLKKSFTLESYLTSTGNYINPVVRSAVWDNSNEAMAVASNDAVRVLQLEDFVNQEFVLVPHSGFYSGHIGSVFSVDLHSSGQYLASGGRDGTIRIWDLSTEEEIHLIELGSNTFVFSVAWSPDGRQLAYGSANGGTELVLIASDDILPNLPNLSSD